MLECARYLLQLQGEHGDAEKSTLCGLLPGDPDDTVGRCIVLHTKKTHLDPKKLPSFPGGPFSGLLHLIQAGFRGGGTGRRNGNQRVVVLLIR